jgi:hypothetical protein
MLHIEAYLDDISEESICKFLKLSNENIVENDMDCFMKFIRGNQLCSQYVCTTTQEKAIVLLKKLANCFRVSIPSFEELYNTIKYHATLSIKRVSDWKTNEVKVIEKAPGLSYLKYCTADMVYTNSWGYKSEPSAIHIFISDEKIIWIGADFDKPQYFISKDGIFFCLRYRHKELTVVKNLDHVFRDINSLDTSKLDDVVCACDKMPIQPDESRIDLTDYFYKAFFYKGFLFDRNWTGELTTIKNVEFCQDFLKVEIENLTYPHSGCVLLDLDDCKIIEKKSD